MPSAAASEPLTSNRRNRMHQSGQRRPRSDISPIEKYLKKFGYGFLVLLICGFLALGLATILWPFLENYLFQSGFLSTTTTSSSQPVLIFTSSTSIPSPTSTERPSATPSITRRPFTASSPRSTNSPTIFPCNTRIVGFYDGSSDRDVTDSQLRKLTHIVFGYIKMNSMGSLYFASYQEKEKLDNIVKRARFLKPALKVMVSIGGAIDYQHIPVVAADEGKRKYLARSIKEFIKHHKVDGVDIFWKWPTKNENREAFVLMLQEIRNVLDEISNPENPYLLTAVTPNYDWPWYRDTLDLNGVIGLVDFVNVWSVRYYGFFDSKWGAYTGPPSPLYSGLGEYENSNVDWTMKLYTCTSKQPGKVNMGVPFFGAYWKNVEGPIDAKGEMWFTAKPRTEGKFDFDGDYISWRDMEPFGWNLSSTKWHQETKTPYIWDPEKNEFLGFENPRSLKEKAQYTIDKNLGGITIWSLEMDDDGDTLLDSINTKDFCSNRRTNTINYSCDNK
ncbi:hypothetical protein CRE_12997 [Caenorhabditis remanei]|uniref:GH18 domain-containing protein n=1 Tax=Caenorhabditis remanei TaxID=31234 RepID=E3N161_CAERE|nr:hypothetical protein CRE_12997 [Caenorhabditis remanei]